MRTAAKRTACGCGSRPKPSVTKIPADSNGNSAAGKRIDYFLRLRKSTRTVTRSFEVKEAPKRLDQPTVLVSDHYPLIAVFEISR